MVLRLQVRSAYANQDFEWDNLQSLSFKVRSLNFLDFLIVFLIWVDMGIS